MYLILLLQNLQIFYRKVRRVYPNSVLKCFVPYGTVVEIVGRSFVFSPKFALLSYEVSTIYKKIKILQLSSTFKFSWLQAGKKPK